MAVHFARVHVGQGNPRLCALVTRDRPVDAICLTAQLHSGFMIWRLHLFCSLPTIVHVTKTVSLAAEMSGTKKLCTVAFSPVPVSYQVPDSLRNDFRHWLPDLTRPPQLSA